MNLMDAKPNTIYKVSSINGQGNARRRLLDMGFTPQSEVYVQTHAPGGGTVLVGIRGFMIALRYDAAQMIEIII